MWVARDKNGSLYLFSNDKPTKENKVWATAGRYSELDSLLFPEVQWNDKEPTEIEITIKNK